MSWTPDLIIGELRPWPDAVWVIRGDTDEARRYVPEQTCHVEAYDDGIDEGHDGEWFCYAPPTWYLSCGHRAEGAERPNFCPSCGARVEVDE